MDKGESYNSEWFQFFDDDSPWDEFKWEAFMRDEDEQTSRFLCKFTQSKDLPNTEEMISRELNGDFEDEEEDEDPDSESDIDEYIEPELSEMYEEDEDIEDLPAPADFRKDPIWSKSYNTAIRLERLSKSKEEKISGQDAVFELMLNSRMASAKIAGAFDLGFNLEGLGGNIANHKKALLYVLKCLDAITELENTDLFNKRQKAKYRRIFLDLREEIMSRIDELRYLFNKMRNEG